MYTYACKRRCFTNDIGPPQEGNRSPVAADAGLLTTFTPFGKKRVLDSFANRHGYLANRAERRPSKNAISFADNFIFIVSISPTGHGLRSIPSFFSLLLPLSFLAPTPRRRGERRGASLLHPARFTATRFLRLRFYGSPPSPVGAYTRGPTVRSANWHNRRFSGDRWNDSWKSRYIHRV